MTSPRSFHVTTFGCQMNEHDSERIAGQLLKEGYVEASRQEDADVLVLNTCCIRENADEKLYGTLGRLASLKATKPGMQIAVGGCLAQKDRDIVTAKAKSVDVVFGTHNLHRVGELLAHNVEHSQAIVEIVEELEAYPSALPARRESNHSAWVTIQIGCDNTCAFCIVPSVRGKEVSRRMGDIVHEIENLAADGVTEITLLGQNVNSYGRDLGAGQYRPKFADLLREVNAIEGIKRIRYTSPHPKDMREDTFIAMAECEKVCNHLHFPLQSGSDSILAAMHRGYTAQRYLEKLALARKIIPDLAVTTDIIVGFPGETDEDFEATMNVVAQAGYDSAYTFVFSPREGTEAALMTDKFVDDDIVKQRIVRLCDLEKRDATVRHGDCVGRIEELLVVGVSKHNPEMVSGRTTQNKLVHFDARGQDIPEGSYVTAHVTSAASHWLFGDLLDVVSTPESRENAVAEKANAKKLIPVAAG
ncbi:MAG TPA: tRNA (N6-isopentenyl adenosine(37)-C2)-methylthiotransferase MiaB [Acidimicrobiia bacterium]|nr:tRNA (N6-isopentenyl adenosine(37)-C2)-methylthiotransferase MiaB [Acidimicrobiia bacterium]